MTLALEELVAEPGQASEPTGTSEPLPEPGQLLPGDDAECDDDEQLAVLNSLKIRSWVSASTCACA